MNKLQKTLSAVVLSLSAGGLSAAPSYLITHNLTNEESNAYVANLIPSTHPTKAHSDGKVSWLVVKLACTLHKTNGRCPAMIKMKTDTANPVDLGMVSMDLDTGDISPKTLVAQGYRFSVNGPAEATLTYASK